MVTFYNTDRIYLVILFITEIENDDLTDAEISPSKALEAADCLILFCEKTEISISDMKVLRRLRQRIAKLTENV